MKSRARLVFPPKVVPALRVLLPLCVFAFARPVAAQEGAAAVSFDAALTHVNAVSPGLGAANRNLEAAQATADALKALRRPVVSASASVIEYQKTLSLDISGAKDGASASANGFLGTLAGQLPSGYEDIAADVVNRVGAALPGLFASIPDTLRYQYRDTVFRPTVTAVLPLYTGGAITAIQQGAQAQVAAASAQADGAHVHAQVNLVRVYFGQQIAAQLVRSTRETLDGFERHLADAHKLEDQGVLAHAQLLQVQVARDAAARAALRAENEYASARDALSRLLDNQGVITPSSALFVSSVPLAPVETFLASATGGPQPRQADSLRSIAGAGVNLARSRYRPQAFGFGTYNFNHNNALPTEPDWAVGVGIRYTLLSNVDRRKTLEAARLRAAAATDAAAESRKTVAGETVRAWDMVEAARRNFTLTNSSIVAAQENVRVQTLSFREGEAAASAVIDAQAALANARTQRLSAAYEYDLALAALLAASDRMQDFSGYLVRADNRIGPLE